MISEQWYHSECDSLISDQNKKMVWRECREASLAIQMIGRISFLRQKAFIWCPTKEGSAKGLRLKNTHYIDGPEQDVLFEWEEKVFCTCLNHNYAEAMLKCDIWTMVSVRMWLVNIGSKQKDNVGNAMEHLLPSKWRGRISFLRQRAFIWCPTKGGRAKGLRLKNTHYIDGPLFWGRLTNLRINAF